MVDFDVFSLAVGAALAGVPFLIREWIRHRFATDRGRQVQRDQMQRELLHEIPQHAAELARVPAFVSFSRSSGDDDKKMEALLDFDRHVNALTRLRHALQDKELRESIERFQDVCTLLEMDQTSPPMDDQERQQLTVDATKMYEQIAERCGELLRRL